MTKVVVVEFKEIGKKCLIKDENVVVINNGKEEIWDVKKGPENPSTFYTFKENALKAALESSKKILLYFPDHYVMMSTNACAFLLNNFSKKIYRKFCSNQNALRIYSKDYEKIKNMTEEDIGPVFWEELESMKLTEKRPWTEKAKFLIVN